MSCPICSKETDHRFRPFCSARCADIDLGRWFTGSYAITADDYETWDGDAPQDPPLEH